VFVLKKVGVGRTHTCNSRTIPPIHPIRTDTSYRLLVPLVICGHLASTVTLHKYKKMAGQVLNPPFTLSHNHMIEVNIFRGSAHI